MAGRPRNITVQQGNRILSLPPKVFKASLERVVNGEDVSLEVDGVKEVGVVEFNFDHPKKKNAKELLAAMTPAE